MEYRFPTITHIDQVLDAIKGNDAFRVVEKEHYTVVNYSTIIGDTFPDIQTETDAILRECRGIIFCNETKRVIARRLHKFFNIGEKQENRIESIDWSRPHWILEKLDGSMITPIPIEGGIRFGTKMGITDVAMNAESFLATQHQGYLQFCEQCIEEGFTPIFEWCSRKNRIVIDYPEDKLVLLAIRNNETGDYTPLAGMNEWAAFYNVPVVQQFDTSHSSPEQLLEIIRANETDEGVVVRFEDGHMVKIKAEKYVRIHKAKDQLRFEKNLVECIVHEQIDDLKSLLPQEDVDRINRYERKMDESIRSISSTLPLAVQKAKDQFTSRKDFAIMFANTLPNHYRQIVWKVYEGADCRETVINIIKQKCTSHSKLEELRPLIGTTKEDWLYGEE